jgi:hypothetical protein
MLSVNGRFAALALLASMTELRARAARLLLMIVLDRPNGKQVISAIPASR